MKEASNHKCYTTQPQGKIPRFPLQCVTFALLLAVLVLSGVVTFVYASDVSDAGYRGQITVANNGTANTSVSTIFTLNTQSLIDTNKLNSSANDCAIQVAAGTDTAFMPSVNSSFPWVTWVPTIGEDETLYQYLFTSGVTGGKIRYFPDSPGMTTPDDADLELGDNFTIEQAVWVDTTAVGANLTSKDDAFRLYVSGSGNITASIESNTPTGHTDYGGNWINETYAYDRNEASYAYRPNIGTTSWSGYLGFDRTSNPCSAVRYMAGGQTASITQIDVDVYYDGAWQNVYQGAFTQGVWETKDIASSSPVTEARVRLYNEHGANSYDGYIYEFEFVSSISATATGVSSGEITARAWADTSYLHISIGGVESDNTSLGGFSVPDNTADLEFMQDIEYMERSQIWVDGVLQQDISWQYATTFTDQSGNSHHATPTFRTASSDPNVSANLTSFTGIMETTPPPAAGQTGWDILPDVPSSPSGFFGEFDPASMTFWGSGYISTFSTATGIPLALIVFPYAFGIAIGAGFIAWYLSSGGGKQHNRGSLLAMAATSLIFMLYFVYGAGGVIPGWILLPFAIEVLVFIVWRQTPSPF